MANPTGKGGRPRGSGQFPSIVQFYTSPGLFARLMAFAQAHQMTHAAVIRHLIATLPDCTEASPGSDERTVSNGAHGPQAGG
jgi:hypothetical protein